MKVWSSLLDHRYTCSVVRTAEYQGQLTVVDNTSGEKMLDENVSLMYDAQFGPDFSDVALWVDKCIAAVPEP